MEGSRYIVHTYSYVGYEIWIRSIDATNSNNIESKQNGGG